MLQWEAIHFACQPTFEVGSEVFELKIAYLAGGLFLLGLGLYFTPSGLFYDVPQATGIGIATLFFGCIFTLVGIIPSKYKESKLLKDKE